MASPLPSPAMDTRQWYNIHGKPALVNEFGVDKFEDPPGCITISVELRNQ